MWREVRRSAAAGGQRVPASHASSSGPPPNRSFKLRCYRNRMTNMHSRSSSVSRWRYGIRAWDRVSLRRVVRPLEHSRVQGWADIRVRRALYSNLSLARPQDRYECAKSRAGSKDNFKAKNEVFLLMFKRAREPSRGGASTWQWQVQSKAAPRRRRFVFNTIDAVRAMARTNLPASPARWSDGPASQARHHGLSNQAHNRAQWPSEQGRQRTARKPKAVPGSK
jgi:hypothetical protein